MGLRFSRRRMIQAAGAAAVAQSVPVTGAASDRKWPIEEGPGTPKICLAPNDGGGPLPAALQPAAGTPNRGGGNYGGFLAPGSAQAAGGTGANIEASYRRIRQIGVSYLLGVPMSPVPWTEETVRRAVDTAKQNGLVAYNSMIGLPASIIYGRDARAKDMEPIIASIQAAGKGGLPVVEYNFYAHRAVEGYYETVGRAGAGYTAFDSELELLIDGENRLVQPIYRDEKGQITPETLAAFPGARKVKFKDLPPIAAEGARSLKEMWSNITYFLKAAVPVAEKAGVLLALHPNDPPAPISRGSEQIMGSLAGWKQLIEIVNSPANGITFDCGVTMELGEDPVSVAEYFASRKRINHAHFRNVIVERPRERYQEVFVDAGAVDMFGVMKALVRNRYTGAIYPEHPRALDHDRDRVGPGGRIGGYPGGGGYTGIAYSVAYTRAMMQAAIASV